MSDSPPPPPGSVPPPDQYPPTEPQPAYGVPPAGSPPPTDPAVPPAPYPPASYPPAAYPPAGGYPPPGGAPPPGGYPPTQAGWGAGGGVPPYGTPPPQDPGGRKVLLIALGVVFGLAALVVVAAVALVIVGSDDNDAPTVDRTTIAPITTPDDPTDTTSDARPGDSALDPDTTTEDTGDREGEDVNVFDLEVGDCFDVPTEGSITDVTGLDCDEPHDNEVFATFEVAGGPDAPFPGDDAISDQAQTQCTGALFTDYVGVPFAQSRFDATSINPTRETWESALSDREVLCVATGPGGETLTASVRGANE